MGFADLSIAEIAADYNTSVAKVLQLGNLLGIADKNPQTRLALEDAQAIISELWLKDIAQAPTCGTISPPELNSE